MSPRDCSREWTLRSPQPELKKALSLRISHIHSPCRSKQRIDWQSRPNEHCHLSSWQHLVCLPITPNVQNVICIESCMRLCEALHNGINVQRVERVADLPCRIPSLRHSFVYVTPSVWVDSVLSVKKLFIDRYMLLCIPATFISTKRPCLQTLSCLFQINKDGNRVFVNLESILNFLCESNQLVFCGVVTSEASMAWCDDIVVFEPPIQTFVNHPLNQCSDTLCQ